MAGSTKRIMMILAIEALRVTDSAMGEAFCPCGWGLSTWTLAKDDLPVQPEPTHSTVGVNWDFLHWFRWLRHNDALIVVTLRTGAVEVFGHEGAILPPRN